jgi:hypothetical protein
VAENFNPVSGGQGPGGLDRALGNLVAIQQALASPDPQVRIEALKEALHHGEEGAQLLIKALHEDGDWEVKFAAWETLLKSLDPRHVQAAKAYRLPLRQVGDIRAKYKAGERDFRWADLSEAELSGASLSRANLSGASLRKANLRGAKLWKANLSGVNLSGANLSGADLRKANLSRAYLSGAFLWDADLSGANLSGAELVGTQLRGANLTGAKLDFGWERLKDLTGTILPDGTYHPSTL